MKVIKPGKRIFEVTCPRCDAVLAYENEDVKVKKEDNKDPLPYIECPCCGEEIIVKEY